MNKNFTKADLKDGMVIEQRNGFKGIIIGDKVVGTDCTNSLNRYTKDLCWLPYPNQKPRTYDVVKVYQPKDPFINLKIYEQLFDKNELEWFTVIWERKEKKEIKLTTEERAFLNSILLVSDYKYIARDKKCDALWVFNAKPEKGSFSCEWIYVPGDSHGAEITDKTKGMFEFITWDDEEPYLIEDLLKGDIK